MDLRDRWAMVIWQGLAARYGHQDGYSDISALGEAYNLADHALGIRHAQIVESANSDAGQVGKAPPTGESAPCLCLTCSCNECPVYLYRKRLVVIQCRNYIGV